MYWEKSVIECDAIFSIIFDGVFRISLGREYLKDCSAALVLGRLCFRFFISITVHTVEYNQRTRTIPTSVMGKGGRHSGECIGTN